jgi:hypothetical protein
LVSKLEESREVPRKVLMKTMSTGALGASKMSQDVATINPPVRRLQSGRDEEREQVLKLDVPVYDKNRSFTGLMKLKMDRKDRHVKAVDNFGSLLDGIAETLEKELLQLSLKMREDIQVADTKLTSYHKMFDDNSYLIERCEKELLSLRKEVMGAVNRRALVIDKFGTDLDSLEKKRAERTGSELKKLVDSLISIAHQLPNDIERIVENETFDLNNILTVNRQSHSHLLQMLKKVQVTKEVETIQKWENGREKWRQLRHDKALKDFHSHINGFDFSDPDDRKEFLANVRNGQMDRHQKRLGEIKSISALTCDVITSGAVAGIKNNLAAISDQEMSAIQVRNINPLILDFFFKYLLFWCFLLYEFRTFILFCMIVLFIKYFLFIQHFLLFFFLLFLFSCTPYFL